MIIDDRKAPNLAKRMHLEFIGTLGLLLEAKAQGVIAQLKPYIDKIQQTNFRVTRDIVDYVLEQAGE